MKSKKILGVIPARLGSTRVPRKMLANIHGKTLLQRTYERTKDTELIDRLIIATDSDEISLSCESFGAEVIMTSSDLPTGTDRVAAAVSKFTEFEPDIVVNIWGDEPLFPAKAIDNCISLLLEDEKLHVGGIADLIEDSTLLKEPSIVKVLTDKDNNAIFFSRGEIPYPYDKDVHFDSYQIVGAMAMQKEFLGKFLQLPQMSIEKRQSIEQMRIIEHGFKMRIIKGRYQNLGVNTPEDLQRVRSILM